MGNPPTDAEIIAASVADPTRFNGIVDRYFDDVYTFVARRIGRTDATDVVQSTFERAFRIRGRYDTSRPNCRPWLYAVAANLLGDRLRRHRRDERLFIAAPRNREIPDPSSDADERLTAAAVADELNAVLRIFSQADRETFLLFAVDLLSYAEIAEVLGIAVGTVGSRISRVRARIKEQLPGLEQRTEWNGPGAGEAQ
ncbi:MAG: RNA polymerase sigma factor [Acidimicrobiia bacterium]